MNFYQKEFFPKITEIFLNNKIFNIERKKVLSEAFGNVLEVGFGSGLNLPYYSSKIESLVGIDPSRTALNLAEKRVKMADFPISLLCGTTETLNIPLASFDFIV